MKSGIEGYDKNKKKLDGKYRKIDDDSFPERPNEEIFDELGNKFEGTYKEDKPVLTGDELYDENGN